MIARYVGSRLLNRLTGGAIQRPGRVQAIMRLPTLLKITVALLRDSRVPLWQRASVVALVALILSPFDVIGDIPVVGQFWDFTLAVAVLDAFIKMAPAAVVNEHITALNLQNKIALREQ